jgi:hypothetical protein
VAAAHSRGAKEGDVVSERKLTIPIDYSLRGAPQHYRCDRCKAHGVKLWREYQRIASMTDLLCAACAMADQGKSGSVDADGYRQTESGRTDQIGWLVPAVPVPEGYTFWSYRSVPADGIRWWRTLPTRATS